jgi:GAF domain-containing protein
MLQLSLEPYSLEEQCARILELLLSIPHFSHNARGAIYLVEDDPTLLIRKAQQGFPESEVLPCLRIPFGQCLCGQAAGDKGTVYTALDHYEGTRHCEGSFPHGHYCVPILLRGKTLGLINIYIREGHKRIGGEDAFLLAVAQTLAGIIDRYQAGQKLKSLEDQLHEAEKMAALWRLTENMAHEIRNPLMAIGGFTRRMEKQFPDGTKERKTIDLIVGEVKRIEKIMQEVESLSETGPLVLREGLLEAAAESVLRVRAKELTELGIRLQKNMPLCPRFFSIGIKLKRPLKI